MGRLRTFYNGIRSMVLMAEVRPYYWVVPFGPVAALVAWLLSGDVLALLLLPAPIALVLHFDRPSEGDHWWAMHFTEVALVVGPCWLGVKDTN